MTSTPPGALRAAVLLRLLLSKNGHPLPVQTATDRIDEIAELPSGDRSGERALRRAVDDLCSWGFKVEWATNGGGNRTVRLEPPEPTDAGQRLLLSSAEDGLRRAARAALQLMDPDQEVEPHVLLKAHVPRDHISFLYGQEGAEHEGVPYGIDLTGRPFVLVATATGDLGFHADAIRSLRIISRGDDISGHEPAPPFVEAEPVSRSWLTRSRGRPNDFAKLREAQILIAAIHVSSSTPSSGSDQHSCVPLGRLAEATGVSEDHIHALSEIIERLDRTIVIEGHEATVARDRLDPHPVLDGPQALTTRLDLVALLALGAAATNISEQLAVSEMERLAAKLDEFLDRVSLPESFQEPLPCAVEIVHAALASAEGAGFPLPVLVDDQGAARTCTLRVETLVWSSQRWWVTGSIDDEPIPRGRIPLSAVLQVDPET